MCSFILRTQWRIRSLLVEVCVDVNTLTVLTIETVESSWLERGGKPTLIKIGNITVLSHLKRLQRNGALIQ